MGEEMLLLRAHVDAYTKRDGTFVKEHETKVVKKVVIAPGGKMVLAKVPVATKPASKPWDSGLAPASFGAAKPAAAAIDGQKVNAPQYGSKGGGLFKWASDLAPPKPPKGAVPHPQPDDNGKQVLIWHPDKPSAPATWSDAAAIAVATPGCELPAELHGVALQPWADHPTTPEEWDDVEGQADIDEPPMTLRPDKEPAAGALVIEPDGRVWTVSPTNGFGGAKSTFPKGKQDDGIMPLQAVAIKEVFEEAGLKVEITGFLGDVERTTSVCRYYLARRVGGSPAHATWESQAVNLVPAVQLAQHLEGTRDRQVAEWVKPLIDS
jgi:8-oxo-dGTP pyrophosphatase MutT (NUDIX family)